MENDQKNEYLDLTELEEKKKKKARKQREDRKMVKKVKEDLLAENPEVEKFKPLMKDKKPVEKELTFGFGEKMAKKSKRKLKRGKSDIAEKKVEKKMVKPPVKKPDTEVKELLETDIDKLYELVRDKGILKVKDASKKFGIKTERVEEWGRVLEDHKLVKLHYPPIGEPVLILKKFKSDAKEIKKLKEKKKLKPNRRVFFVNLAILLGFIGFVALYMIRIPTIRISYIQVYLAVIVIIIIGITFILKYKKAEMISFIKKIMRGEDEKGNAKRN